VVIAARRSSWRKTILATTRQFPLADRVALTAAAVLVFIFWFCGRPWIASQTVPLLLALGITAAFALLARYARGVNSTGALAGSVIAFIFAARDVRMFWLLLLVFAITLGATRLGAGRKQRLRTAEGDDGRSGSQVMANLGVAGLAIALAPMGWPVLALAALAEAAADTASSEVGMAFPGKTVLITSWRSVPPGMDGGISLTGTVAGLAAATLIAAAGLAMGLVTLGQTRVIIAAGFLGTLLDSLLGALLERRGWLNNDLVNLLSTAGAGGIAWLFL
jgi:uncharacterized protein (TIGR00297 family)